MIVTPSELDRLNRLQNHTRSGELVVIEIVCLSNVVSDDEVLSHYETNKNSFVTEDSVALEYVLLSADNFQEQVVITDEDIRAAYDAEVAQPQVIWNVALGIS